METSTLPLKSFRSGDTILEQGQASTSAYLVFSGRVVLERKSGGHRLEIAQLGRGEFFGELDRNSPNLVTARALEDCTLLHLDRPLLEAVFRQRPEVATAIFGQLTVRVAAMLERTVDLPPQPPVEISLPPPPAAREVKLARHLLHPATGRTWPSREDSEVIVGRADPVSGAAPDIDLGELEGGHSVHRRHASITDRNGGLSVRALPHTANGTFVNGRRIPEGEEVPVQVGDEVCFGIVRTFVGDGRSGRGKSLGGEG